MDGPVETRNSRMRPSPVISAIFVHAGAGYHSTTNEKIHLAACNDAVKAGMKIMKAGGSAVDAVEAAIRVLEDKEITNAGYGSNLTLEGIVEGDATIVDHFGRSGACGAVPKIKNPIHLARMILDTSSQPLSLRRVPPNILVGEGATSFAYDHGIPVLPHDALISSNARERFLRWREDLKKADGMLLYPETPRSPRSTGGDDIIDLEYIEAVRNKQKGDHVAALLSGTWNEGQPDSPPPQSPALLSQKISSPLSRAQNSIESPQLTPTDVSTAGLSERSPQVIPSSSGSPPPAKRARYADVVSNDGVCRHKRRSGHRGGEFDGPASSSDYCSKEVFKSTREPIPPNPLGIKISEKNSEYDEDYITDTVGAIAIDAMGRIAAGSSSGGIGMKHCGRVGPAALVGVGTAVIPADVEDPEAIAVAAVTSGTGEHMATTLASQKCAERLFHCDRKGVGHRSVPATDEEAMESFVTNDFMQHPGVLSSHSAGAIGVMAVKKTPRGYYLHFAHNTDSFALASLHSNEKNAKCVMSRITDQGGVVCGGRKIRID